MNPSSIHREQPCTGGRGARALLIWVGRAAARGPATWGRYVPCQWCPVQGEAWQTAGQELLGDARLARGHHRSTHFGATSPLGQPKGRIAHRYLQFKCIKPSTKYFGSRTKCSENIYQEGSQTSLKIKGASDSLKKADTGARCHPRLRVGETKAKPT